MGQSSEVTKSPENAEKEDNKSADDTLSCARIFNEIGGFGPFQILVGISTGLALIMGSFTTFNFIFASIIPEHR